MVYCIPVVTRKILTWHILLTIIGYLCLIRREEYNFPLIMNKVIFISCLQFPTSVYILFLWEMLAEVKRKLPSLRSELKDGQPCVAGGSGWSYLHTGFPPASWPSRCHEGFIVVWSSPEDKDEQDPPASDLSRLQRFCSHIWAFHMLWEGAEQGIYFIIKASLSDSKRNFCFWIQSLKW